jgi:hypothetical protein
LIQDYLLKSKHISPEVHYSPKTNHLMHEDAIGDESDKQQFPQAYRKSPSSISDRILPKLSVKAK